MGLLAASSLTGFALIPRHERNWRRRSARGRWPDQQSGGEFSSAVSPTRARDAAVSKYEDAAEVQFSSRPGPESFQSGAASHHPAGLQAETLDCIGGVARTCRVGRRLRADVSSSASVNPVTLTTPSIASESTELPITAVEEQACATPRRRPH